MSYTSAPWTARIDMVFNDMRVEAGNYIVADAIGSEADAKLIAAAPDLLEACKALLSVGGGTIGFSRDEPANIALRAAIAKAEG